jgi:hypothetical protein
MSDFITCTNKDITPEQLVNALLTKTATGDWALRTMQVEACATDAIDCDNKHPLTLFDVLKRVVGINECGKPAIRLAIGTDESGS